MTFGLKEVSTGFKGLGCGDAFRIGLSGVDEGYCEVGLEIGRMEWMDGIRSRND